MGARGRSGGRIPRRGGGEHALVEDHLAAPPRLQRVDDVLKEEHLLALVL
jgi:hypothetical protein